MDPITFVCSTYIAAILVLAMLKPEEAEWYEYLNYCEELREIVTIGLGSYWYLYGEPYKVELRGDTSEFPLVSSLVGVPQDEIFLDAPHTYAEFLRLKRECAKS